MADKKPGGAGLRGQVAGRSAICTVAMGHSGLTYYGYEVGDLAEHCEFEEVAYLLFNGELPTQAQLDDYKARLKGLRGLPDALKEVLERIPASAHPMDVMRTGTSFLGNIETEQDFSAQQAAADRLVAALPSIICYWYRYSHDGVRVDLDTGEDSIGGHFLHLLHDESPSELHAQVMNVSLILYAEHEFNASTFTARVITGTLSDMHSAVTGAIGALRGQLHGQPHRVRVGTSAPRELGKRLLDLPQVQAIELLADGVDVALSGDPGFYRALTELGAGDGPSLAAVTPLDDSLASVFGYLVG